MRHLRSILYALVLAPAAWILCGVGFDRDLTGRARDNGAVESFGAVMLLLLAGAAYGILLFAPISPAGPLLAGLTFLGVGIWSRIAPEAYAGVWPAGISKDGFDVSTPGYGLVVLLAVPLLATSLSARRWAGYEPPQVVLVGTIGRVRGAVPAPGTPMAAEPTTVFAAAGPGFRPPPRPPIPHQRRPVPAPAAPSSAESTRDVAASEEPTTRLPAADEGEPTTRLPASDEGEPTTLLAAADEEPTTVLLTADDERTTVLPARDGDGEKTQVIRSEVGEDDTTRRL
ncbi:hypothetical protein [Couchioplanes caeruleus]|uniref:Uncharacterized protein n=2 Tax=Couchioplanes caeruleus TaxID=56438 RepID=A0A1K0GDU4_9ACTN|nr:hypothetical protein [Couchioplanes caeruleus]OJF10318.1 hypothetical protein BG844_32600 [Couchioplanes caeruleus subsp. caeruleus]ROP30033.1 hypothetical protein EDD30_2864 [Couchioplanes caeruleus]